MVLVVFVNCEACTDEVLQWLGREMGVPVALEDVFDEVEVLTTALAKPWGVASLPDGRLVITEKAGALRIVTTDGVVGNAITGFPEVDSRSQGGLLDVAPAPDFETSRMLYFTLAEFVSKKSDGSLTAVGKGKLW